MCIKLGCATAPHLGSGKILSTPAFPTTALRTGPTGTQFRAFCYPYFRDHLHRTRRHVWPVSDRAGMEFGRVRVPPDSSTGKEVMPRGEGVLFGILGREQLGPRLLVQ